MLKAAVHQWAFGTLTRCPGCRALCHARRERGDGYTAALCHVGNRLLSSLHHCVRTGRPYQEHIMFPGARDGVMGGQDEHLYVTFGREP
ncbi:hypothetical protein ACFYO5_35225 [Streptomyces sp. NPDC006259]|uniref:hypothetical protein n=1 Tax=Streptomyces sp. NPDC006259 TaxID=3364740 RepID=UPI00367E94F9